MKVLDILATWIQRLLSFLPPDVLGKVWLPVLIIVVLIALRMLVRKLLPAMGGVAVTVLRWVIVTVGAILLLPDLIIAMAARAVRQRPPGIVYAYGDAVAGSVISLEGLAQKTSSQLVKLSKVNFLVVVLLTGLLFWAWDGSHCDGTPTKAACAHPVADWWRAVK